MKLLKTGSAFYAPSAAVAQIVDAIILDKKQTIFCTTRLDGELGESKRGKASLIQIIPLALAKGKGKGLLY